MIKKNMITDEKKRMNKGKKAQVTLFIIIALVIVSALLVFLLYVQPRYFSSSSGKLELESCIEQVVSSKIVELGEQGGFAKPEFYFMYLGEEIPYLCYTNLYYQTCTIQKPFLKQHFQKNLLDEVEDDILECYDNSIAELRGQGYEVLEGDKNISIGLEPDKVIIDLQAPVTLNRESSRRFTNFRTNINSGIYNMLIISTTLLQYESTLGDSDVDSLMFYYPDYSIQKLKQGDGTTIYIVKDIKNQNKFQFASKSLVWPAGYTGDNEL